MNNEMEKVEENVNLNNNENNKNKSSKKKKIIIIIVILLVIFLIVVLSGTVMHKNLRDKTYEDAMELAGEAANSDKEVSNEDVDAVLSGCKSAYTYYFMEDNTSDNLTLCDFINEKAFSGSSIKFDSCSNNKAKVKYNDKNYTLKLENTSDGNYKIVATYGKNKIKEIELEKFGSSQSNDSTVQNNNIQSNHQQVTTTIEQKDEDYFNNYLEVFMSCDGEFVSRNTTSFTDEDISKFVSNYVILKNLKENIDDFSGEYTYELSKSEVDSLVYKYFNTKSYNIKKIDGMAMSSITQKGNNYKFEWEAMGCGYTQYKNPVVTYNGTNVTVKYDLYDAMAEEYAGTSTFHLRYNNGNYNIVKIEK